LTATPTDRAATTAAARPAPAGAAANGSAQRRHTAGAPRRRTQAERSETMRRRILDAAVDVLAAKGYAGFRTADVAELAGVSRGAQTHHFPSKDELVVAVVEHVFQRTAELGRQRAAELGRKRTRGVRSTDEAIQALITDSQEFFFSELFLIALDLAIQGRMQQPGDANPVTQISAASRLPVEASWLAALVETGVPAAVAEDLLWLTISIVRGLAVRRLWQHDAPRFKRLFKLWRVMIARYLDTLDDNGKTP
jgi:AcrR family transcriptional regulator